MIFLAFIVHGGDYDAFGLVQLFGNVSIICYTLFVAGQITESLNVARSVFRRPSVLLALNRAFHGNGDSARYFAEKYLLDETLSFTLFGVPFSHTSFLGILMTTLVTIIFTFGPSMASNLR